MYNPFSKPLEELEYSDIEAFCKRGVAENIYLDYKQEIKADKLSQSIASFANTKGGILLIGVSEDKTTKLPSKWDGIDDSGTLSETLNQIIANVTPIPTCRFQIVAHKTTGKAFVVIVTEEGASAPYFTVHKPVVYVRTGDVSTPIAPSDRASLLELSERGNIADAKIQSSLDLANLIFDERYERAKDVYEAEQERNSPSNPMAQLMKPVDFSNGYVAPLVISSIIPRNPYELTDHKTLLDKQVEFRYDNRGTIVPLSILEPVRYGLATSSYDNHKQAFNISQQKVRYTYVSKYGLLQLRRELNDTDDGRQIHNLFNALYTVAHTLCLASTYYARFNYSGSLRLKVELENLDKEVSMFGSQNIMSDPRETDIDLSSYDWTVDFSTHDLNTEKIREILTKLFTGIYLDLGFQNIAPEARKYINDFQL